MTLFKTLQSLLIGGESPDKIRGIENPDILPSQFRYTELLSDQKTRLSEDKIRSAYISLVQMLIQFRARNACSGFMSAKVKRRISSDQSEEVEEENPWRVLFENPCLHEPASSSYNWLFQMLDTRGAADFLVWTQSLMGRNYPYSLIPIYPEFGYVTPVYNGAIQLEGWSLRLSDGNTLRLAPEDVIRIKVAYPGNPYQCLSKIEAAAYEIDARTAHNVYIRDAARNQGLPRVMLEADKNIDPTAVKKAARDFARQYSRAGKDGVPTSTDGLKVVPLTISPKDIEFLGQVKSTKTDIYDIFEVQESIFSGEAYATGRNAARLAFIENVLQYLVNDVCSQFSFELGRVFKLNKRGSLYLEPQNLLPVDRTQQIKNAESLMRIGVPVNRLLEDLGEEPVDGGDTSLVPMGFQPLSVAVEGPTDFL